MKTEVKVTLIICTAISAVLLATVACTALNRFEKHLEILKCMENTEHSFLCKGASNG